MCLDKAVLAQEGGGGYEALSKFIAFQPLFFAGVDRVELDQRRGYAHVGAGKQGHGQTSWGAICALFGPFTAVWTGAKIYRVVAGRLHGKIETFRSTGFVSRMPCTQRKLQICGQPSCVFVEDAFVSSFLPSSYLATAIVLRGMPC